jgi:hypothetical protein
MKITSHFLGNFIKDGTRYRIMPEEGDEVPVHQFAQENGYERAAPLTGEALQEAIAAQRALDLAARPRPVPRSVPLWAFRQVLIEDDLLATILAAIAADAVLLNFLEYGNFVDRASPSLAALAAQLGKTETEVDELFRRAAAKRL